MSDTWAGITTQPPTPTPSASIISLSIIRQNFMHCDSHPVSKYHNNSMKRHGCMAPRQARLMKREGMLDAMIRKPPKLPPSTSVCASVYISSDIGRDTMAILRTCFCILLYLCFKYVVGGDRRWDSDWDTVFIAKFQRSSSVFNESRGPNWGSIRRTGHSANYSN